MLAVYVASYAIEQGNFIQAVELLEQGRNLLWSQMRGLRTPLDHLSEPNKDLADKFADCSQELETLLTCSDPNLPGPSAVGGVRVHSGPHTKHPLDEMVMRVRQLLSEQENLIHEIRRIPGFEDFLQAASFETLKQAASEGPVIVVNDSVFRCDALIILAHDEESCVCVPLDGEWYADASELCNDLLHQRYEHGVSSIEYDQALRRAMKELWDRVVSKVIRRLSEFGIATGSRIW